MHMRWRRNPRHFRASVALNSVEKSSCAFSSVFFQIQIKGTNGPGKGLSHLAPFCVGKVSILCRTLLNPFSHCSPAEYWSLPWSSLTYGHLCADQIRNYRFIYPGVSTQETTLPFTSKRVLSVLVLFVAFCQSVPTKASDLKEMQPTGPCKTQEKPPLRNVLVQSKEFRNLE